METESIGVYALKITPNVGRGFADYYWLLVKHFGRQLWETRGREFVSAAILAVVTFVVSLFMSDSGAGKALEVTFLALLGWLTIFVLVHLLRAPWLIHSGVDQYRMAVEQPSRFGVLGIAGIALSASLAVGASWWLYTARQPNLVLPSADAGAQTSRIAQLQAQLASVSVSESPDSLRRRTVRLVNELNLFWSQRPWPQQQPGQNPTSDEDRARNARWDRYWQEAKAAYTNKGFSERILGIVREYKAKGVPTGFLEQGAEQPDRLIGAAPYGGYSLDNCTGFPNDLCQLRELAFHVNAQDQRIDPTNF